MAKYRQMSRTDKIFYKLEREKQWEKQGRRCIYCGEKITKNEATFDHKIPISQVGYHSFENCVVACYTCNQQKANKTDWSPDVVQLQELTPVDEMINRWKTQIDNRVRRFEWSLDSNPMGSFNKWTKYWEKRHRWG